MTVIFFFRVAEAEKEGAVRCRNMQESEPSSITDGISVFTFIISFIKKEGLKSSFKPYVCLPDPDWELVLKNRGLLAEGSAPCVLRAQHPGQIIRSSFK